MTSPGRTAPSSGATVTSVVCSPSSPTWPGRNPTDARAAFLQRAGHEFRTALALVAAPLGELGRAGPDEAPAYAAIARRNTARLGRLVETFLNLSRAALGHAGLIRRPTDLARITAELAEAFRPLADAAGLTLRVVCPPCAQPVSIDVDMWTHIVLSLLSNAFKFTFEGGIEVALREQGADVVLEVSDSGVGIPAGDQADIFWRRPAPRPARARASDGAGMGLPVVRELARAHGGSVALASRAGAGTAVTVRIPRHAGGSALTPEPSDIPVDPAAWAEPYLDEVRAWLFPPDAHAGRAAARSRASAARVLVVDDNADMRDFLRRLLGERWWVDTAPDGLSALARAHERVPDVVVTDVMMPGLDGYGLLRALRADDRTRDVPVIFLSAHGGDAGRAEGLRAGADVYLAKPFDGRDLVAEVESRIAHARLRSLEARHSARLAEIFRHAPLAIVILRGADHVCEFANEPALTLIGRRDAVGRPMRDALAALGNEALNEDAERLLAAHEPIAGHAVRVRLRRPESGVVEDRAFDLIAQPLPIDDDGEARTVVMAFEVTDLVHARQMAESASQAKDEFLAMLGHELRNPLAPILTAVQLMTLREARGTEYERTVIERQTRHLVRLVDDLLDVSRITRGKIELRRRRLELAEVVTQALEISARLLAPHDVVVDVAVTGLVVDADPSRLSQAIANIVGNAGKYTEPRGRITVAAAVEGADVVLRVRDTGIGIEPDMLPRIFDMYVQARHAVNRAGGGLGLGLAIAESLVRMHGGSIAASSPGKGQGTEFAIRLPLAAPLAAPDRADQANPDGDWAGVPGGDTRVLVVDDNRDAADVVAWSLSAMGYATEVAYDGAEAVELARRFHPQVAVLDIGLPSLDGYELAARLRDDPDVTVLVTIALTGYGQRSDRARSREAGFTAHLVKPVDIDQLDALIREALGGQSVSG